MKYLLLLLLVLLTLLMKTPTYAQSVQPLPTPFSCVGGNLQPPCSTVAPSPSSSISVSTIPSSATSSSPGSSQPSSSPNTPSPTTNPCATQPASVNSQSTGSVRAFHHGKSHFSGNKGFLQLIFQFLLQLLQLLFQQLGIQFPGGTGSSPCPSATPSATPSAAVSPSGIGGGGGNAPSTQPSGGATPTIFGTSPSPTITIAPTNSTGTTPTLFQDFNPPWSSTKSPDGLWQINGNWTGTEGNEIFTSNATISATSGTDTGGFLNLSVQPNSKNSGEIQTIGGYGYGYYQVRMKVTSTPGVVVSFFWKELNYAFGEIDYEFLTNESWISSANSGIVHVNINNGPNLNLNLPFNPSKGFHTYGFLYTAKGVQYDVDGKVLGTQPIPSSHSSDYTATTKGYIMMNTWTGVAAWGGGPPTQVATSSYDWVKYYANVTAIPK